MVDTRARERSPQRHSQTRERSPQRESPSKEVEESRRGRTAQKESTPDTKTDGAADDPMEQMRQLMGFDTFDSTKGKKVDGADVSGVKKKKKAKFRQYMNREKGFNRPLSPERKK